MFRTPARSLHATRIVVELFGDLYHCNPWMFSNSEVYVPAIQRTVAEQWKRDERKIACFKKHGYKVVVVWEYDFRRNPEKEIERIKNEVGQENKTA